MTASVNTLRGEELEVQMFGATGMLIQSTGKLSGSQPCPRQTRTEDALKLCFLYDRKDGTAWCVGRSFSFFIRKKDLFILCLAEFITMLLVDITISLFILLHFIF